jgi:hypothetical protein
MLFHLRIIIILIIIITLSACPNNNKVDYRRELNVYPVSGQITLDGVPIRNARIAFHPLHPDRIPVTPVGISIGDGTYRLTTYQLYDGAPAGEYLITIVIPNDNLIKDECSCEGFDLLHDMLHGAYMNPKQSHLRCLVKAGINSSIPIRLKSTE